MLLPVTILFCEPVHDGQHFCQPIKNCVRLVCQSDLSANIIYVECKQLDMLADKIFIGLTCPNKVWAKKLASVNSVLDVSNTHKSNFISRENSNTN